MRRADGSVDEKAYAEFVDWQIKEGTDALVPVGTTGESPTVDFEEHCRLIKSTIERVAGHGVIAGYTCGGPGDRGGSIDYCRIAEVALKLNSRRAGRRALRLR